jgi:hypothetical protein
MKKNKTEVPEPKFHVGQVVAITADYYTDRKRGHYKEMFQRITQVWPWPECAKSPWGYSFRNGDECNEQFVRALTKREAGR